jgi:cellulose biosynthesis protein BcsQ
VLIRVCLNQYQPHLTMTKEVIPLLTYLEFPVLDTKIKHRTIYKEVAAQGSSVFATKNKEAQIEIKELTNEIANLIK